MPDKNPILIALEDLKHFVGFGPGILEPEVRARHIVDAEEEVKHTQALLVLADKMAAVIKDTARPDGRMMFACEAYLVAREKK
jgi:hypothetical protein